MSQALKLFYSETLETVTCCACGVVFAMPASLREQCLKKRAAKMFYCPNGHSQHYTGETEVDQLRRELDAERKRRERALQEANELRQKERAARGQITRLKKRIAHGVCPCCKRTFANLARHMKSKHPEELKELPTP